MEQELTNSRVALHVNYIPKKLVGRESEFSQITKLLTKGLTQNNSLCVYISGVPGTGKTATVRSAIKELQQKRKAPLKFLELNGMKLSEPSQAYVELWKLISGKEVTPKHAIDLLNAHFSDKSLKKEKILVIMDELDVLMTRKQDVIYHFFDWPYKFNSNLIVVAIANTMDLPERLLHHKVSSRLGSARINFAPYDHNQLYEIVRDRLGDCLWFTPDAIEICSRKVAAVSGDARRALDICRNAVEVFELEIRDKLDSNQALDSEITTTTINKVYKAMYDNPTVKFIQSFSLNLKLILVSLLHLIKRTGITEVSVEQLISKYIEFSRMHTLKIPTQSDLLISINYLINFYILTTDNVDQPIQLYSTILFNIGQRDVELALKLDKVNCGGTLEGGLFDLI